MKISVLGCGRWGTFIAHYLSNNNEVFLWGRENGKTVTQLLETRQNDYLKLSDKVKITTNLKEAVSSDILIISILTQELNDFLNSLKNYDVLDKKIIFCMKGIEATTGRTLTQIAIANGFKKENLAVWVGPGHVQNFVQGIPNCMVISAYDKDFAEFIANNFSSSLIRFYINLDIVGVEIGSATKNVIGIMSGLLDGLSMQSLKGALMARATKEVSKLISAVGGNVMTAYGLSHLGDYEATLFSPFSHNRMYGEMLCKGEHYGKSAEGVGNTKGTCLLAEKYNVDMPLTFALNRILFENANPKEEILNLFCRPQRYEFC